MQTKETLEKLLRGKGLKVTSKRLELLTLIANYNSAIPYSKMQKSLKNYDRVTLYRTLKFLLDACIIHKAFVNSDDTYYAMCKQYCASDCHQKEHIHFKCLKCLNVSCVDISIPLQVDIPNVVVQQVDVEVSGICANCKS